MGIGTLLKLYIAIFENKIKKPKLTLDPLMHITFLNKMNIFYYLEIWILLKFLICMHFFPKAHFSIRFLMRFWHKYINIHINCKILYFESIFALNVRL